MATVLDLHFNADVEGFSAGTWTTSDGSALIDGAAGALSVGAGVTATKDFTNITRTYISESAATCPFAWAPRVCRSGTPPGAPLHRLTASTATTQQPARSRFGTAQPGFDQAPVLAYTTATLEVPWPQQVRIGTRLRRPNRKSRPPGNRGSTSPRQIGLPKAQ